MPAIYTHKQDRSLLKMEFYSETLFGKLIEKCYLENINTNEGHFLARKLLGIFLVRLEDTAQSLHNEYEFIVEEQRKDT